MKKLYIGISGKMGSGKSTLTNGIVESMDQIKAAKFSLATPIKRLESLIYSDLDLPHTKKDRDLLIALGMWGRNVDSNFWLDQAIKTANELEEPIVICDDVRFENEAKWFKENGILMRIHGEQRGENVDESKADDVTETQLDNFNFDYYIDNRGTVEETVMSALYCIAEYLGVTKELMDNMAKHIKEA